MSGTRAGVSLRVGVQADGVRENLEAIGATGQKALQGVADAARQVEPATASLTKSFERTQQVLDPAARAAATYAQQLQLLARAEEAGLATAQRANELRERAAMIRDRAIARLQSEAAAVQAGAQAQTQAAMAAQQLGAANDNAAGRLGGMGGAAQVAGQQIQQLWGNISSGQNVLVAVATQAGAMLALTGGAGAAVGAVMTYLATKYGEVRSEASKLTEALQTQSRNMAQVDADARQYRDGLEAEALQVRKLTQYYGQLSQARRSQELRQFEADRASLAERQGALRDAALGRTAGLSQQLQQQISDAEQMAARSYGRGSTEYEAIVSAPELARMREVVDVIETFRAKGDVSREALAQLRDVFQLLGESSDGLGRQFARQVAAFDGLTGRARDLEGAQRDLAARGAALGQNMDTAASAAERLRRQMDALSQYNAGVFAGLDQEVSNLQMQLAAASVGAGRLAEVRGQIQRDSRLEQLLKGEADRLRDLGITGTDAASAMEEFRGRASAALDRIGALGNQLRTAEDRLRSTGGATRELSDATRVIADIERDREALMSRGQSTYEATRTEAEKYAERLGDLRNQLAAGAIDQDTFNRAVAAADPAVKEAQKAAEAMASRSQQTANAMESNFAGAFTRAFEAGEDAGKRFLETIERGVKSLAATIAAQLVFRMAVVPVVNSVGSALGYSGSLLGTPNTGIGGLNLGGLFGNSLPVASNAGSTTAAMQSGQQSLGLATAGRYGNLGSAFTGQGLANTGWGFADGIFNTPLIGSGQMVANVGSQTFNGLPVVNSIGMEGMTVAGGLGAGAGILGGAYGIYSGIQKGGIGGAVGVAGGLAGMAGGAATIAGGIGTAAAAAGSTGMLASMAPTLSALGPYGMIAAAVLAIVSALLPGQKPSGRGQEFRADLGSDWTEKNGLGGSRYSAENASQAEAATMNIVNLANQLSSKLGGVSPTGQVAVGVTSSRGDGPGQLYLELNNEKAQFANTEEGAKQLADKATELLLKQFRDRVEGDYKGILEASPTIEALQTNLEFYEGTYKSFQTGAVAANQFQQSMDALNKSFGETDAKARELGLATDDISAAWEKAQADLTQRRDLQLAGYDVGLTIRSMQASGADSTAVQEQVALMQFDLAAAQQLEQAKAALESLGLSTEDVAQRIATNESVLAQERLRIQQDYADQAAGISRQSATEQKAAAQSVLDWLNNQALGDLSSLSAPARQQEAERQYREALAGTDASAVTSAAQALLSVNRDIYGQATTAYAQSEAFVRTGVANFGIRQGQAGGNSDVVEALSQLVVVMQQQLTTLGSKFDEVSAQLQRQNGQAMAN